MYKPKPLKKGSTIGIISPAGKIKKPECLARAVKFLNNKGYEVKLAPNILESKDYLAGDDGTRLKDLQDFFSDDSVDAILCSRGGYGCARLLDKIDFSIIEKNPKMFLGHSDITAFLNNFPVVTFHSPLALGDFGCDDIDETTWQSFESVTGGVEIPHAYKPMEYFFPVNSGTAQGNLVGGNLSIVSSLMGTLYQIDFVNNILLLEDLNEPMYKIDRMLTQLRLAGVFDDVAGVVIARFSGEKITKDFLKSFIPESTPAFYGTHASHEKVKYTLPMNVKYKLNADTGELILIEQYLDT